MSRTVCSFVGAVVLCTSLAACGGAAPKTEEKKTDAKAAAKVEPAKAAAKDEKPAEAVKPVEAVKPAESGEIALVPGSPEKSQLLVRALLEQDHDDVMPPEKSGKPLSSAEKRR